VITLAQPDRLGLGSPLEHGGTSQFEVLDQDNTVPVTQDNPIGILHDTGSIGDIRLGLLGPFKGTGDALPFVGVGDHLFHRAFWAGWK